MTQCGLDRAGYISLLMATEQVNGIVRVASTRASFQEFIGQSYCLSEGKRLPFSSSSKEN
jgi:hypothetical protein